MVDLTKDSGYGRDWEEETNCLRKWRNALDAGPGKPPHCRACVKSAASGITLSGKPANKLLKHFVSAHSSTANQDNNGTTLLM